MAELLKIDRNGSKHWRGERQCDRCGGRGYYAVGVHNGELVLAYPDDGICYKCGGRGKVIETWIERTPGCGSQGTIGMLADLWKTRFLCFERSCLNGNGVGQSLRMDYGWISGKRAEVHNAQSRG